ncbi:hypothetical protein RSOL_337920 [Rhizoctonia solani AG-3 Rhs1AP]|uniref:Uncharacterized protein n=1 Tax=Rhizoctonia solani AG-3 Rhs1AP TaxID=1086054 RepID=X8JBQ6_9AGAM|nr:hypothetical protein RSOL_337920 [Rhizoctonia solani AG-3 Rhs1AP]
MSSHIATGASGSRGKARSRLKHYHRKTNSNVSNRYARQQDTSSSHSEIKYNHRRPPVRSFSKGKNATQANLPPPPRYNQRKPWVGIFGAEREHGNITILRRQDAEKPKGNVPSWLADTFGSLPNKHPLRETVNDSTSMESLNLASDDDDNPFAYQPPSPSRTSTNTRHFALPYFTPTKPTRVNSAPSHHMGLSSIPFAPPTFIEPTYEDHYQDMTIPLNDYDYDYESETPAYWADLASGDRDWEPTLPTSRATPQFESPQRMSSPIFLSGGYPLSPIATTPTFETISSDDLTLPTPTHSNILAPETDEIQDALRANHPFVTSMYASSPAGSFRGLPLDALVGDRESSPHSLVSISHNIPMPDAIHSQIWISGKGVLPQAHIPPRPVSSDVYKSRLLAYATTVADHMSSSGDEDLIHQQTNKRADLPEAERAASSLVTRETPSFGLLGKRVLSTLSESLASPEHRNDLSVTPGPYTGTLGPGHRAELQLAKSLAAGRLAQNAAGTHTTSSVLGASDNDRSSEELAPTNLDGNFDMADTYLEDREKEHQREDTMDEFEEDEALASEYEVMQEEYVLLAVDEPSDDESWLAEPQRGSEAEHSVLEVDNAASIMHQAPKRDPRIQSFPMRVSHRSPVHDTTAPGENQPVLSRLLPKSASGDVRPSLFATLLKKRFKDHPDAVGPKRQDDRAAGEDQEDEIEPWSG